MGKIHPRMHHSYKFRCSPCMSMFDRSSRTISGPTSTTNFHLEFDYELEKKMKLERLPDRRSGDKVAEKLGIPIRRATPTALNQTPATNKN